MNDHVSSPIVGGRDRGALKIAGYYLLAGALWILVSDQLAAALAQNMPTFTVISTVKGWGYAIVTATILYWLVRRHGRTLLETEKGYRFLFGNMLEGYARCKIVLDEGRPLDFVYLEVNQAFETLTGLKNVVGKPVSQVIPGIQETNADLLETYGRVALTGKPERLESFVPALGIWFSISVYSPAREYFVSVFDNITSRKRTEEQVHRQLQRLNALHRVDTAITTYLDLPLVLDLFLEQVTTHLGVDAAAILQMHPATQSLDYANGRGFRTQALQHTHLRLGEGLAGRVALERRVLEVPDLRSDKGSLASSPLLAEEGFVAYIGVPLLAKGQVHGVLEIFHRQPFALDADWRSFLEALATQAAIAIDNMTLFGDLQKSNAELSLAYDTTLEGWSRALDLRDKETEGHTERVTDRFVRPARDMGMGETELVHVRRGALLHDIGKMGIPDSILLKPGPLTADELETMRMHPEFAYRLLSPIAYLRPALDIAYCHHEKWDGTGYPRGLKGEEIPLVARIFAVVDVWDALTSHRPYRPAWTKKDALEYVGAQSGKHFDPQVVQIFLKQVASEFAAG